MVSRHEPAEIRRHRDELVAGLSGGVIEVGAGVGRNFAHYPLTVEGDVAVEPEPYLPERGSPAAASADIAVEVLDGMFDDLPSMIARSMLPWRVWFSARRLTRPARWPSCDA